MTLDPRYKHLAAALLVNAAQQAEYLLAPNFQDPLFGERLFEGFEALVWIWSPASTTYFEAIGRDPEWGRTNLHLDYHVKVALDLALIHREILLKMYLAMGRSIVRMTKKKSNMTNLRRFAEQELQAALALLAPHALPGGEPLQATAIRNIIDRTLDDHCSTLPEASLEPTEQLELEQ